MLRKEGRKRNFSLFLTFFQAGLSGKGPQKVCVYTGQKKVWVEQKVSRVLKETKVLKKCLFVFCLTPTFSSCFSAFELRVYLVKKYPKNSRLWKKKKLCNLVKKLVDSDPFFLNFHASKIFRKKPHVLFAFFIKITKRKILIRHNKIKTWISWNCSTVFISAHTRNKPLCDTLPVRIHQTLH